MARVQLSSLVTSISGSVGDNITFARRGAGFTVYAKTGHGDAKTEAQLVQRNRYKEAVAAWNALPGEEKAVWNRRAAAVS